VVIHPECYGKVAPEVIIQAKARATRADAIYQLSEDDKKALREKAEDLSKKKRVTLLEKQQKVLLSAIQPFYQWEKAFKYQGIMGQNERKTFVVSQDIDGNVCHFGKFEGKHVEDYSLLKVFATVKKYKEGGDPLDYVGLPNDEVANVSMADLTTLSTVVDMVMTKQEDALDALPIEKTEATSPAGEASGSSTCAEVEGCPPSTQQNKVDQRTEERRKVQP
jgi:hypothetical protein